MANAQLQPIYDRLNGIEDYKPYTAGVFADWSLEAGDIVTTVRDGVEYSSPVHVSSLQWNGRQKMDIESHGEKTRGSVTKMSIRSYNSSNGGGNGYRGYRNKNKENKEKFTILEKNDEAIILAANDLKENTEAQFKVTADKISAEVKAREKQGKELGGRIGVEAGRISAVVTVDGKIRAGMIVDAINNDSTVTIKADRILLDGTTTINDVMKVSSAGVFITRPLLVGVSPFTSVYLGENRVMAGSFQIRGGSSGRGLTLNVVDASVNGNILTITHADGSTENFSKATSLKGAWSGSMYDGKAYRVRAIQEGSDDPVATDVSPAVSKISSMYSYWEGNKLYLLVDIQDAKGESVLRKGVDVTGIYDDGKGSVTPESHHTSYGMVCTKATPVGSGQSDYTFEMTARSGRFSYGDTPTFWI